MLGWVGLCLVGFCWDGLDWAGLGFAGLSYWCLSSLSDFCGSIVTTRFNGRENTDSYTFSVLN